MDTADGDRSGFEPAGHWHDDSLDVTAEDLAMTGAGTLRVLRVSGDIDTDTAPVLEDALKQAAADQPHAVVVDLSGLTFGDSATLNALLQAHHRLPALVIAGPLNAALQRLFTLAGLDAFFTMTPDVETAVEQLTSS